MKVVVFSARKFEIPFLEEANKEFSHELTMVEASLNRDTAKIAHGYSAINCFVNDKLDADTLALLHAQGVRLVSLRSAGFNHVDVPAAKKLGITVTRVPAYSPYAVAEFAVGLILSLNRKIHRAYQRTREQNFSLEGLLGFDLHGKTVGVIGTGKIGAVFANIMQGFGCHVIAYDPQPNKICENHGVKYQSLEKVLAQSDIISLHCPLNAETKHMINKNTIALMKSGVMLVNTGRGGLIDTCAAIESLKTQKIGYLGLDVYEEEENLFFRDLSEVVITDDVFSRLLTFPNVIITGHQGFFTREALTNIARVSLANIHAFEKNNLSDDFIVK